MPLSRDPSAVKLLDLTTSDSISPDGSTSSTSTSDSILFDDDHRLSKPYRGSMRVSFSEPSLDQYSSSTGTVVEIDEQSLKALSSSTGSSKPLTMIAVNDYHEELSPKSSKSTKSLNNKYYVCPSNTFIATNGDVYHVEPFQLPPPNEIAGLFQELKKYRRERTDSNLSDLDIMNKDKKIGSSHKPEVVVDRRASLPSLRRWVSMDAMEAPSSSDTADANDLEARPFGALPSILQRGESSDSKESVTARNPSPVKQLTITIPHHEEHVSTLGGSPVNVRTTPKSAAVVAAPKESLVFEDLQYDLTQFSLLRYLHSEVFGAWQPGHLEPDAARDIHNFLHVPYKVEELIQFGFFICLDSFLFVLTILPLRVLYSLCLALLDVVDFTVHGFILKVHRFHRTHAYDTMRGALLVLGCSALHLLNMSRIYHFIRGQTMIKLYVLTGMMDIFNNLLGSFGQTAFDSLYYQTCSQTNIMQIGFAFLVVCGYVLAHSGVYFIHVATLTVAFNSDDQALISVLILNNFSEIKGFVFKKFDKQQLFQLSCSDVTERFILFLFYSAVMMVACAQAGEGWMKVFPNSLFVIVLMVGGEAIADWVKHGFISKFNKIDASVYEDYGRILRKDVISAAKNASSLDHTYAISRRVGLAQIPLGSVFLRFASLALSSPAPQAFIASLTYFEAFKWGFLFCVALFLFKVGVAIGLLVYSVQSYNSGEQAQEASKKKLERNIWMDRLSNIERYTVWKGKIVG